MTEAGAPKWGLVSTVKAPTEEILRFVAYHLEHGAHRVYVYLDEDNPEALDRLKSHPKVRVRPCGPAHWKRLTGKRPEKHQVRQSKNATHAYNRPPEVDWLVHIDVDEFLWPNADGDYSANNLPCTTGRPSSIAGILAALPDSVLCARVRPEESLAGDGTHFKAFVPAGPDRQRIVEALYPTFGRHLRGGFLSHLGGKVFVRTGLPDMKLRIHNAFRGQDMNPNEVELTDIALCHCHAKSWEQWLDRYRYRLEKGSYRESLVPPNANERGNLGLNNLFRFLEAEEGENGLRMFFDEVCADTPALRARLEERGLLRRRDLQLASLRTKHFPD